jgi:hypothetical protein
MPLDVSKRLRSAQDWIDNRKAATHWYTKKSNFDWVNTAVDSYFTGGRSYRKRLRVDRAIHKIRIQRPGIYRDFNALLMWLAGELERLNPHQVSRNTCGHFGPDVGNELNEMCNYAVTDLQSFPGNIRNDTQDHRGRVWNRYYSMSASDLEKDGQAGARVRVGFNRNSIRSASAFLEGGKCGCCTTFAARAADILLRGSTSRVEIVAVPTNGRVSHCFVIVGRTGAASGSGKLTLPGADWGTTFCVVDPWLGALGFECIYPNGGAGFPANWLRGTFSGADGAGLEQKFDSEFTGGVGNFLKGVQLKKTKTVVKSGVRVGNVVD